MSKPSPFEVLTREQLIERLEIEVWAAAVPHIARHLADQVMASLGINPRGVHLVMWVGGSHPHSNATALTQWIARQIDDPFFKKATSQTPPAVVLARLVTKLLESAEAANS